MKRLVWIALAMAAGVVVALMIASLLLQQQAGKVVDDLRAPVASLRKALLAWDRQRVRECTDGVSDEDYSRWFDDYNSGNPVRRGRIEGVFA